MESNEFDRVEWWLEQKLEDGRECYFGPFRYITAKKELFLIDSNKKEADKTEYCQEPKKLSIKDFEGYRYHSEYKCKTGCYVYVMEKYRNKEKTFDELYEQTINSMENVNSLLFFAEREEVRENKYTSLKSFLLSHSYRFKEICTSKEFDRILQVLENNKW